MNPRSHQPSYRSVSIILATFWLLASSPLAAQVSCGPNEVADRMDWSDPDLGWQASMNGDEGPHTLYSDLGVAVEVTLDNSCGAGTYVSGRPALYAGRLDTWVNWPRRSCSITIDFAFSFAGDPLEVRNLQFTARDVDEGNYDDLITYSPSPTSINRGWSIVPVTDGGHGGFSCSGTAACDMTPVWSGPVDAVSVLYEPGPQSPSNPGEQFVEWTDLQFCVDTSTVPISLASFESAPGAQGLEVQWTTATETANVGFRLYGRTGEGPWMPLTDSLIPGAPGGDALSPRAYSVTVPDAGYTALAIEDIDTRGKATRHGPFTVGERIGEPESATLIDWAAVAKAGAANTLSAIAKRAGAERTARLTVTEPGLQRVTHKDLLAAGVDLSGTPVSRIAVQDEGEVQVRYVGGGETFGAGSWVEFIGEPGQDGLYQAGNIYVLTVANQDQPVPLEPPLPGERGLELGAYDINVEVRQTNAYDLGAQGASPWYDARLLAYTSPVEVTRTLVAGTDGVGDATLTVEYWGVTNWPGDDPDHHVQVLFNGEPVIDDWFDGTAQREIAVTIPRESVLSGENTVTVRVMGDTGFDWDVVNFSAARLHYASETAALDGRLSGVVEGVQGPANRVSTFVARGFDGAEVIGWGQRPNGKVYRKVLQAGAGNVVVPTRVSERIAYWLVAPGQEYRPTIHAGTPEAQASARADYLIVTHAAFMGSELDALVALQQGRGLSTAVVDVQAIYAAYSDHAVDAEAIRRFIAASQPKYVLLVGGDSYDYNDYLGLGSLSFVPTHYVAVSDLVRYSPSDVRHGDTNADGVPDIPVGRLPVRTRAELAALVDRMTNPTASGDALFISGKSDSGRQFETVTADMVSAYGRAADVISVDESGLSKARSSMTAALADNPEIVSFHGHTSFGLWDFGGLYRSADVAKLPAGARLGLVTQWGCWNSYFVSPQYNTMAHALLLTPGKGAVAVLGSATLTESSSHAALAELLFARIGTPGNTRIGDALLAAQRQLARTKPDALDALLGMNLLGDPAGSLSITAQRSPGPDDEPTLPSEPKEEGGE